MLVIFDCDGVLVDSEPIANRILAELLCEHGLPTDFEESMREYRGRTQRAIREAASAKLGRPLPDDFWDVFDARFFARCEIALEPIPGARDAVSRIAERGHTTCVASSGSLAKMDRTLAWTGLRDHFAGRVFSATDVPRSKPHPDVFLHAAARMQTPPHACCVVEDSPLGVAGARAAGMAVLGFASGAEAGILSDAGAETFDDIGGLSWPTGKMLFDVDKPKARDPDEPEFFLYIDMSGANKKEFEGRQEMLDEVLADLQREGYAIEKPIDIDTLVKLNPKFKKFSYLTRNFCG